MVEIAALLLVSWALVWFLEKGNLSVLGLNPTGKRLKNAAILLIITAICCSTGFAMRWYFGREQFTLNPNISTTLVLTGIWLTLKSVLFEELLCRGAGLYLLIKKLGQKWAILISAMVFAILHWSKPGIMGNAILMTNVFVFTFIMGLILAYAFAKSRSLYLPIAIHLGWNLIQHFVFPEGDSGDRILVSIPPTPEVTVSYAVYGSMILLPMISAWVFNYLFLRRVSH